MPLRRSVPNYAIGEIRHFSITFQNENCTADNRQITLVLPIDNMFDHICLMYKIGLDFLQGVQSFFFQRQFSSDQNDGLF